AHSTLPLTHIASSSFGLVLLAIAHRYGWPFPKGGAASLTAALVSYYESLGGKVHLSFPVTHVDELPLALAYVFDLTPNQLLQIGGTKFTKRHRQGMGSYRYGAGVPQMEWALRRPLPYKDRASGMSATAHLGFRPEQVEPSERASRDHPPYPK